jgi:hypothetical protein
VRLRQRRRGLLPRYCSLTEEFEENDEVLAVSEHDEASEEMGLAEFLRMRFLLSSTRCLESWRVMRVKIKSC